jgi:hypothetical protein
MFSRATESPDVALRTVLLAQKLSREQEATSEQIFCLEYRSLCSQHLNIAWATPLFWLQWGVRVFTQELVTALDPAWGHVPLLSKVALLGAMSLC